MNDDEKKELERQLAEVKARYSNTPLWLKAPNGEPSNLTPEEWAFVHTPYFKEKYGDWEALFAQKIICGEPLSNSHRSDIAHSEKITVRDALRWIESNPQPPAQTVIGEVLITRRSIKNDFAHYSDNLAEKLYALPTITDVLEKGAYLGELADFDGNKMDNYFFAAPVSIDEARRIVFVRTRKADGNDNRFYVHDVYTLNDIKNRTGLYPPSQIT